MKVYLICNTENKYKIGFTERNTNKRIKELQTGSHSEMHIVQEYESTNARQIETILHRFLKSYKILGEWFSLPDDIICNFKVMCQRIDTNLNYLNENKI